MNEKKIQEYINKHKNYIVYIISIIPSETFYKEIINIFGKEIDTIYLTFCDPWPKKQDEKRRFTHPVYLRLYDRIFKKHKHIILKTDNKGFFAYSLEYLSSYWYTFNKVSLDLHHDERNIPNIMTNYEKQYFKEGRPIYYVDAVYED